jgi:colanic acid/amylovoran biosynthesis glycosyltransferase
VLEGESAILVPERDVGKLTDAFRSLLENEDSWEEMGKVGRSFVIQNYDINVLNEKLVNIYNKI